MTLLLPSIEVWIAKLYVPRLRREAAQRPAFGPNRHSRVDPTKRVRAHIGWRIADSPAGLNREGHKSVLKT